MIWETSLGNEDPKKWQNLCALYEAEQRQAIMEK